MRETRNHDLGFTEWGPYLSYGKDSSTEMRISWESDQYLLKKELHYGLAESCETTLNEKYSSPEKHHCFILSDLTPNTKYYYKIYSANEDRDSLIHTFKTGPILSENEKVDEDSDKTKFEFSVISDIHASEQDKTAITQGFEAIENIAPDKDFFVVLGDSINNGNLESDWMKFFENTNNYIHDTPMMNTTGNHDTGNRRKYARFVKTWDHPYEDIQMGAWYKFRYANAVFFMLDSDNGGTMSTMLSDEQFEWLEEQLEEAHEQDLWIFICFHRQMYSTGDFSMEPILHSFLRPLFDEYHVDCVFYGHDHNYQAFWCDRDSDWGGTKYIVAGGGGGQERMEVKIMGENKGETIYVWPGRTYSYERDGILPIAKGSGISQTSHRLDFICESQLFAILEPHFVDIKIAGNKATLRAIGWQNQVYHEICFNKTSKI